MHAAIEYQTKHITIHAPSEWVPIMRNARPADPYSVQWLSYSDFKDWKGVESEMELSRARDENNRPIRWSALRQVKVR